MKAVVQMWVWGFAAGVFLMTAINGLGDVLSGGGALPWVELIGGGVVVGGVVVVVASIAILLRVRSAKAQTLNDQ